MCNTQCRCAVHNVDVQYTMLDCTTQCRCGVARGDVRRCLPRRFRFYPYSIKLKELGRTAPQQNGIVGNCSCMSHDVPRVKVISEVCWAYGRTCLINLLTFSNRIVLPRSLAISVLTSDIDNLVAVDSFSSTLIFPLQFPSLFFFLCLLL